MTSLGGVLRQEKGETIMKNALTFLSLSLLALTISGCMRDDPRTLPPGRYNQSSSSVDSKGTAREQKSSTDVYYDEQGHKKVAIDRKTSTDPEGLFNKSTTETHESVR